MTAIPARRKSQLFLCYDTGGNILTTTGTLAETLGAINPLTYRGYVFDQETQLYYVSSRYYNPAWGRFLNADILISTGQGLLGNNMFAYCRNNPVCRKDISGTTDVEIFGDNSNLLDDDESIHGGKMGNGESGGGGGNGGKYTFKSDAALNEHFDKHKADFGDAFSTPQEYVDAANDVIQRGEYVPNQNAYVKFYGMNGRANYAFVGMSHDHAYITTFHLKHASQILF